jgi:hypothetical protein
VLPFADMSGDSDQDHFAEGITDDIIRTNLRSEAEVLAKSAPATTAPSLLVRARCLVAFGKSDGLREFGENLRSCARRKAHLAQEAGARSSLLRDGDPVMRYLASRGIKAAPSALRYHPSVRYWGEGGLSDDAGDNHRARRSAWMRRTM